MNQIKVETITRTIILGLAMLNQILAVLGKEIIDIAENDIYQCCTLIATISSALWNWWKNNSFTKNAVKADETLQKLKAGE